MRPPDDTQSSAPEGALVPLDATLAPFPPKLTPFKTNCLLSPEREKWLLELCKRRTFEVMNEMGRQGDGTALANSWMGIRVQNKNTYQNDLEWRKAIPSSIFSTSNFTLGTNRRYARLLSARVRDDLLGTIPFFGAVAEDEMDKELAKHVERYVQDQIGRSNVADVLKDGLREALICNEAVIKTTYLVDQSSYYGPAKVAVGKDGLPIVTKGTGEYVYENDDVIEDPVTIGLLRLRKDPTFAFQDGQLRYVRIERLKQRTIRYDNAFCKVLEPRDFLCPLQVATTDEADYNADLYYVDRDRLRGIYANIDVADRYFQACGQETGATQPKRMQGETDYSDASNKDKVLVAEIYIRCAIHADEGDYEPYELMVVMDLKNDKLVFYDYLDCHMKRRPYGVIPGVEKESGRWYGIGVFSKMFSSGLYIDTQINRVNEKASQANSIRFFDKMACEEWKNGAKKPTFGSREIFAISQGYNNTDRPPVWEVNLRADADLDLNLVDRMQQASDLEFGVISSRDASASDLNQSNTATGVLSIERDANVLTKDTEADHIGAIERILGQAVELELDQMNPATLMLSQSGELITLNREEIRTLNKRVRLLMTNTRSAEQLQMNEKAEAVVARYYQYPPPIRVHMRDMCIEELKALKIDNAEEKLAEVTKEDIEAYQAQQEAAAQAEMAKGQGQQQPEDPEIKKSMSAKFGELARSEQEQILARDGIQPASPEEIAQKEAQELAQKKAEAAMKPQPTPGAKPAQKPTQPPPK